MYRWTVHHGDRMAEVVRLGPLHRNTYRIKLHDKHYNSPIQMVWAGAATWMVERVVSEWLGAPVELRLHNAGR